MDEMTAAFGPEIRSRPPVFPPEMKRWMAGMITQETAFEIFAAGPMGPAEIGGLIEILVAQMKVLDRTT